MARLLKSKTGGLDVWIGEPTAAQKKAFNERHSGGLVAYFRGDRPNLGRRDRDPIPEPPRPPRAKRHP